MRKAVLLAALYLLLILTYLGWRMRREADKKEERQYEEDLSRADYEGMTEGEPAARE
jgi:hypothetical protein